MTCLDLHLESAERQLTALLEKVEAMKTGSPARVGNQAHDAEMATWDLMGTWQAIFSLADRASIAEQDGNVILFRVSSSAVVGVG